MIDTLTPLEQERAMAWCERHRAGDVRLRYTTYAELDPDEEPYGDASAYHHPRRRWPWWKVALRGMVRAATWKYRRVL